MEFDITIIASILSLTALEIVLGIDNVVFIALLGAKLPAEHANQFRRIAMVLALFFRILLMFSATWILSLREPIFTVMEHHFSTRDIFMVLGGLFLIYKSYEGVKECFDDAAQDEKTIHFTSYTSALIQALFIDLILSIDSVLTAVALTDQRWLLVTSMTIGMIVMVASIGVVSEFIVSNPSIKILALVFIAAVGVILLLEGFEIHFDKSYLYFAMFFATIIEIINVFAGKRKLNNNFRD
jgi:predicted tellurium resistance membrane protein TerC